MCIYLSICLSIYSSISTSVYLYLSMCLFLSHSVPLSLPLSPPLPPSLYPSFVPFHSILSSAPLHSLFSLIVFILTIVVSFISSSFFLQLVLHFFFLFLSLSLTHTLCYARYADSDHIFLSFRSDIFFLSIYIPFAPLSSSYFFFAFISVGLSRVFYRMVY